MRVNRAGGTGQIRIIGGRLRGSRLAVADSAGLRPTPDRVRETLFNWLQPVLEGASCLDLFAGTGALGVEALSRGAAQVTFVERSPQLAQALRENLLRLNQTTATVRCTDASTLLGEPAGVACDVVFVDPPFADAAWSAIAAQLQASSWLAPRAWVYVEYAEDGSFEPPAAWRCHRHGRAGQVQFALYRRSVDDRLS